jgi:predicted transcriptional regulator of viral defense system
LYIHAVKHLSKPSLDALYEIAEGQQGLFATRQATQLGFKLGSQHHHVKMGNWIRLHRGIYRLARFPQGDQVQLVLWHLWSQSRAGEPQGVYSHQTALSLYELSDVMPAKLHLTVPPAFRRNAAIPKVLVLHWAALKASDIETLRGFRVTRPLPTILTLAREATIATDLLEQALADGRRCGLIRLNELTQAQADASLPAWFAALLKKHST